MTAGHGLLRLFAPPLAAGIAAGALLVDRYFVGAIALGFGAQVGLYLYLRQVVKRRRLAAPTAVTVAGTGTSSIAMIACCAHHVADVLPLVGLSGLALFLGDYRVPLMALGIGVNAIGVAVMLRLVVRERRFLALASASLAEGA